MDSVQKRYPHDDRIYMITWFYTPCQIAEEEGKFYLIRISGSELQKIPWDTLILRNGTAFADQRRDSIFRIAGSPELNECFFHLMGDSAVNIKTIDIEMGDYKSDCAVLLQNSTGKTLKKVTVLTKIVNDRHDTLVKEKVDLDVDIPPRSAKRIPFTFHKINSHIFPADNIINMYADPTYLIDYTLE